MANPPDDNRLAALEERIRAAQKAQAPAPRGKSKYTASSLAWRMVLELVVGMGLGVGIGYGLDSLFGTLPIFLMIFALLGFAAGIRTMMRTAGEVKNKRAEGALLGGDNEGENG
ncbi:AtpZ/AtpI family protein [Algicella marina]|uniref:ATP synthase protein I n=1 Tax=Algicella marina TaxID=2683284 RepID=A0A6P1T3C7_9RHOB|nr:AtpZ/AtpI family protein [Algicella marina]QHQ35966.1 F0F1 ATP synthase subunit I [Algicella marina]